MFLKLTLMEQAQQDGHPDHGINRNVAFFLGGIIALFCGLLAFTMLNTPKAAPDLAELVQNNLAFSGVENPVTAVLLNFRSYDTLLEIAVLLIVATALLPSPDLKKAGGKHGSDESGRHRPFITTDYQRDINPLLLGLARWLIPLALLIGGYLLWTGAYAPGGAFQAAAVIAGAGIVLVLVERHTLHWAGLGVRVALAIGLLFFVLAAIITAVWMGTSLAFPPQYAGLLILIIEVAATVSIATVLLLLFSRLRSLSQRGSPTALNQEAQQP